MRKSADEKLNKPDSKAVNRQASNNKIRRAGRVLLAWLWENLRSISLFFDSRDERSQHERFRRAYDAESQVADTPLSDIENKYRIDKYEFSPSQNGYHTNPRFRRPKSRSEEQDQFARADQNNEKRVQAELATTHKD